MFVIPTIDSALGVSPRAFIKLLAALKTSAGFGWEPGQPGRRAVGGLLIAW